MDHFLFANFYKKLRLKILFSETGQIHGFLQSQSHTLAPQTCILYSPGVVMIITPASPLPKELVATTENV